MQAEVKDVCRAQTERSEDLGVPALMKRQKESSQDLKSMWVDAMQVVLHPRTSELQDPRDRVRGMHFMS